MTHTTHPLRPRHPAGLLLALIFLAALPAAAPALNDPEPAGHSIALPYVASPPRTFRVASEVELSDAFYEANGDALLPTIILLNDIALTAPLPVLDNPHAGTATIDGNGHTIDGQWNGPLFSFAPGTEALIEDLTIQNSWGDCGGAIHNEGILTIRDSLLAANTARDGGAICVVSNAAHAIKDAAVLVIEDTTLSGNEATSNGGAIYAVSAGVGEGESAGDVEVTVTRSWVVGNAAGDDGGGIFAHGSPNNRTYVGLFETTLDANRAVYGRGGAIFATTSNGFMYMRMNRSTVSDNTAGTGAGLYQQGATGFYWYSGGRADATIYNSTFSGNVATSGGGAIANVDVPEGWIPLRTPQDPPPIGGAYIFLAYSTVAFNRAGSGGGIMDAGGAFLMASIVAGNEGGDCDELVGSAGYNLDGDNSCGLTSPSDVPGGLADLRPLALNAPGLTATHGLGPESQARDRIPAGEFQGCFLGLPNPDQRRVTRPQPVGGRCDIGSFEARIGE